MSPTHISVSPSMCPIPFNWAISVPFVFIFFARGRACTARWCTWHKGLCISSSWNWWNKRHISWPQNLNTRFATFEEQKLASILQVYISAFIKISAAARRPAILERHQHPFRTPCPDLGPKSLLDPQNTACLTCLSSGAWCGTLCGTWCYPGCCGGLGGGTGGGGGGGACGGCGLAARRWTVRLHQRRIHFALPRLRPDVTRAARVFSGTRAFCQKKMQSTTLLKAWLGIVSAVH